MTVLLLIMPRPFLIKHVAFFITPRPRNFLRRSKKLQKIAKTRLSKSRKKLDNLTFRFCQVIDFCDWKVGLSRKSRTLVSYKSAIFFALWKKWYDFLQKKIRGDSGKVPWRHWKSIFDSSLCIVFGTVVYIFFWWKKNFYKHTILQSHLLPHWAQHTTLPMRREGGLPTSTNWARTSMELFKIIIYYIIHMLAIFHNFVLQSRTIYILYLDYFILHLIIKSILKIVIVIVIVVVI